MTIRISQHGTVLIAASVDVETNQTLIERAAMLSRSGSRMSLMVATPDPEVHAVPYPRKGHIFLPAGRIAAVVFHADWQRNSVIAKGLHQNCYSLFLRLVWGDVVPEILLTEQSPSEGVATAKALSDAAIQDLESEGHGIHGWPPGSAKPPYTDYWEERFGAVMPPDGFTLQA